MGNFEYVRLILVIIVLIIGFILLKSNKSNKYNNRISKYTVKNNSAKRLSLGDRVVNVHSNLRKSLVKYLKKSIYFKNKAIKYERFSYIDTPINLIATKFTFSILFGIVYIISSMYELNFELPVLLLFLIIGYLSYNVYLLINEHIRNKQIEQDLLKAIIIMNNAFKSGYNITQAIEFVSKDLTGPISDEFKRISSDMKYGLELKDVFDRFYTRVKLDDVKYITSSLSLLNLTGGNLVGIFTSIEKSFTNSKRIKDELNAMTSSSKLVFYILLGMPIVIIIILLWLDPTFFSPMFQNPLGILLSFAALILYIFYILVIRKILRLE